MIVGASPDLRQQILQTPELAPPSGTRTPPIVGVVLVSADIDGIAGLLTLREGHAFRLFAPPPILDVLNANGVFASLDPLLVERIPVSPGCDLDTRLGLSLRLLAMPGKVPLYQEEERTAEQAAPAASHAARFEADGQVCIVAPGCAEITDEVRRNLTEADLLFFDGTLFRDDEMIEAGLGWKTGRRMGHVSLEGPEGTLARLAGVGGRRVLFHINNTNPVLLEDSAARRQAEAAGFEIGYDGMRLTVEREAG